jgi:transcriptional regulator with XRE-family HTH domain
LTKKHVTPQKITNIDWARIGRIVALERKSRHLTVESLAAYIGCDHSTLTGYEKGRRPIPADRLARLYEALGVEPEARRIFDHNAA